MRRVYIPIARKNLSAEVDASFKNKWNKRTSDIWHSYLASGIPDGTIFDLDIDPLRDDWREWVLERDPVAFLIGKWQSDLDNFQYNIALLPDTALLFKLTWGGS